MEIRFDSFGRSSEARTIRFAGLRDTIRATTLKEVVPALEKVERAVAAGLHAAGFVAYEAAPALDPALVTHGPNPGVPLVLFGLFEEKIREPLSIDTYGYDRVEPASGGARSEPGVESHATSRYPATERVENSPSRTGISGLDIPRPDLGPAEYDQAVATILGYIGAGDSYQVNLSFRLRGRYRGSHESLYRNICRAQRSDFCASIRSDDFAILSASPELFFQRDGTRIRMKPMKGTLPRGRWTVEDDAMRTALAASSKDRAENLMIVDLLRNDLGRIATFGSVEVRSLYDIERYPTVFQMTSTIEAEVAEKTSLTDVFRALFPCGSITGAPKVRTTEIIRELEPDPRGVYTGAIGFVSPGEVLFSVAIRTVTLDLSRGEYELGVGSGITADSEPASEYEECLNKGAFLNTFTPEMELLESLRLEVPGGYQRLDGHLERLDSSAQYFDFACDLNAVREKLAMTAEGLPGGTYKVRLLLSRLGEPTSQIEAIPTELPPARLGLAEAWVNSSDRLLYHKTTYREPYRRALAAFPDCDDVVLQNERGELTESCTGNLVLDLEGELVTPPITSGLLNGVLRTELVESGRVREQVLTIPDLRRATRIYVINSVRGWRDGSLARAATS